MIVGYVTWGDRVEVYAENLFSILTFLPDPAVAEICVFTERPEFYARVRDRIRLVPVTAEEMADWTGTVVPPASPSLRNAARPSCFRGKIRCVETLVALYPGQEVLFLDCDTFRSLPLGPVGESLEQGIPCMFDFCGLLSEAVSRSNRAVWALIRGKTFAGFTVDEHSRWYNSGAVGLPAANAREIAARILRLNDELYAATGFYSAEELAFSFVRVDSRYRQHHRPLLGQ
ncbi:MAG: hypothetical protein LIP77_00875 [Planctomycetes bacterium]|nr:hypothetical protein [Planctomycetota bacterium]